jgi:hypothetical protein
MRPIKGFTVDHVASYLYMVLRRNGACRRSHIIHTRLLTKDGRPIYILYLGDLTRNYTLRAAYVVSSIQQARSIYPELRMQTLPLPLQWSKDTSDYMWNPYRPTLGILWDTYIHITEDRRDRLHESLQKLPAIELRSLLRRAVDEGRERAQLDSAYALPNYSSRYNTVNLMLPLRLAPTDDEPPENVLMLTKRAHGYALLTVLTVEQAYLGVCAFRDPETTWLRGAL